MADITLRALDGSPVVFIDTMIASGAVKDVYFTKDKKHVLAFFRQKLDVNGKERLEKIVGIYRQKIFQQDGGEYWQNLFCWPERLVEYKGRHAVLVPAYSQEFYFKYGSQNPSIDIKGKEKQGKWFADPWHRYGNLDSRETGDWRSYFNICLLIARAVRRMHAAGLAHSDLSYKNVLVDPADNKACIIDLDGLVVPGKFPPAVLGTTDFIAPEVMQTLHLPPGHPLKKTPNSLTDQHALAVLIYMYLLCRHPLRGRKINDPNDVARDEELSMGEKALYIEHQTNRENWYSLDWVRKNTSPRRYPYYAKWMDLDQKPSKILGPYIEDLLERAFVKGLQHPPLRPLANEWEDAILKTLDMMQQCQNPKCQQKWFVYDNTKRPVCPFCNTRYKGILPILNLYSKYNGSYRLDNHRITVFDGIRLYQWHVNRNVFNNEKLSQKQREPVAWFQFHTGSWYLVNKALDGLIDLSDNKRVVKQGENILLESGKQILLSDEEGGRLIQVQMVQS